MSESKLQRAAAFAVHYFEDRDNVNGNRAYAFLKEALNESLATCSETGKLQQWTPAQRVVCAALRDSEGRIVTGARHFDQVMMEQIRRGSHPNSWRAAEQGFIDQYGAFLTREEAHAVAVLQGQILRHVGSDDAQLFSENLY